LKNKIIHRFLLFILITDKKFATISEQFPTKTIGYPFHEKSSQSLYQFTGSHAFISSATKSQYNNNKIKITTAIAIRTFLCFIIGFCF